MVIRDQANGEVLHAIRANKSDEPFLECGVGPVEFNADGFVLEGVGLSRFA